MKIIILSLLFTFQFLSGQTPSDTVNQYNEKHQKKGYWLAYLNERLCIVEKKEEACYYLYFPFDDGYSYDGLFCSRACKSRNNGSKFETTGLKPTKGQPILLTGNFKTYDETGKVIMNENFDNGVPTIIEDFMYNKEGICTSKGSYDYTKKYKNQAPSFCYQSYDSNNKLKENYYYGKNHKGKWGFIK